ncbi:unnamed protein product, partial [Adineta steineri]
MRKPILFTIIAAILV